MKKVRLTEKEKYTLNLSEKLLMFYRKHPVQAAKDLLGVDLVWFQRIALNGIWNKKYVLRNTALVPAKGVG